MTEETLKRLRLALMADCAHVLGLIEQASVLYENERFAEGDKRLILASSRLAFMRSAEYDVPRETSERPDGERTCRHLSGEEAEKRIKTASASFSVSVAGSARGTTYHLPDGSKIFKNDEPQFWLEIGPE